MSITLWTILSILLAACIAQSTDVPPVEETNATEPAHELQFERPFKQFAAQSNATSLQPLIEWLDQENVTAAYVKLVEYPETDGRGIELVAAEDIAAGILFIISPMHQALLSQALRVGGLADVADPKLSEQQALALALAHARNNASDEWHIPATTLPKFSGHPAFWDNETIAELQGSGLKHVAENARNQREASYESLSDAIKARVSKEDYMWAIGAATTYGQRMHFATRAGTKVQRLALVPLLTFIPVGSLETANTQCGALKEASYIVCNATRLIRANETIRVFSEFESHLANAHLLLQRGFIMPERNLADRVPVPLPRFKMPDEDATIPMKMMVWNNTRGTPLLAYTASGVEDTKQFLPPHLDLLMIYVRLMLLQAPDMEGRTPKEIHDIVRMGIPYSVTHETDVAEVTIQYLQSYLDYYGTTLEEDQQLYAVMQPNCTSGDGACMQGYHNTRTAMRIRMAEKEIVASVIARLQEWMNDVIEQKPSVEFLAEKRSQMLKLLGDEEEPVYNTAILEEWKEKQAKGLEAAAKKTEDDLKKLDEQLGEANEGKHDEL